jgi:hypothetical protein
MSNFGIFKKYLQCVLAVKILTVYFVVCTLAVKKNQGRFRHVGSDHSLVSPTPLIIIVKKKRTLVMKVTYAKDTLGGNRS